VKPSPTQIKLGQTAKLIYYKAHYYDTENQIAHRVPPTVITSYWEIYNILLPVC